MSLFSEKNDNEKSNESSSRENNNNFDPCNEAEPISVDVTNKSDYVKPHLEPSDLKKEMISHLFELQRLWIQ